MLQANRFYIKTAVDIRHQILAGGGEMHSDCEVVLLDNGSQKENIGGQVGIQFLKRFSMNQW